MRRKHSAWLALSWQGARLMQEAQQVIALRLMRLGKGGARAQSEARRMVSEKFAALIEAQAHAATAVALGQNQHRDHHRAAKKFLGVYRKCVRRNRRRLTRPE